MPRPRCRAGWSCCAISRSRRARPSSCSWCWSGRWRRRSATASSCATRPRAAPSAAAALIDLRAPERRRRTPERRAEIEALARARDPAARGGARCSRHRRRGSTSTRSAATARSGPAAADRIESDLALVVLPAGDRTCGHAAGHLGAAARAHRPDARRLPRRAARPARHRPRAAAQGRQAGACRRRSSWPRCRRLAEAGEVALDRTWVRRPRHEVRFSERGGAHLGADPARGSPASPIGRRACATSPRP